MGKEILSSLKIRTEIFFTFTSMPRKPPLGKSLAEVNPELAKEWHPTKNGELTPFDVSPGSSSNKVWWKCPKGDDHEWEANVGNRTLGTSCPICRGHKVVKSNCLTTTNLKVAKEWHLTKNKDLTPNDVTSGSNKKVWWKCSKGDDHEWEASTNTRTSGVGCPICSGYKVVKSTCLATVNPELAKEWHPIKNKDLTPNDVVSGNSKKVWWKCPKGDDHEWEAVIDSRNRGNGCLICAGRKVVKSNCLTTVNPKLAKEWHLTKNKDLTPNDVTSGSNKKVWWKCSKGDDHEWEESIGNRSSGRNCPYCSGHKLSLTNTLDVKHPDIAKELHPTKNNGLDPTKVYFGSLKKAWWKCINNDEHIWETRIFDRVRNKSCPFCLNMRVNQSNYSL